MALKNWAKRERILGGWNQAGVSEKRRGVYAGFATNQ
jgi:hypothetical protein